MTSAAAEITGRRERGNRTRRSILEAAAQLASSEGLEGLSIARLAGHVGISKSGLYAHFRSKEQLQLETIRTAGDIYTQVIVEPALALPSGRARVLALTDRFFDFIAGGDLPGGCFFTAAALDPARLRPPVRQALAEQQRDWLQLMEQCVAQAQREGEIRSDLSAREITFDIQSALAGGDIHYVLFGEDWYLEQGRAAVRRCIGP